MATDVHSKNTSDLRKMSSKKLKDNHSEADEDCYLSVGSPSDLDIKASSLQKGSPSVAQKRETHTSKNSVNMLSSSTEISHKTRKRWSFIYLWNINLSVTISFFMLKVGNLVFYVFYSKYWIFTCYEKSRHMLGIYSIYIYYGRP